MTLSIKQHKIINRSKNVCWEDKQLPHNLPWSRKWKENKVLRRFELVTYKYYRIKRWVPNQKVLNKKKSKYKLREQNTGTPYTLSEPPQLQPA